MPLNLHVGLPGPFSYTKRLGGRNRGPRRAPGLFWVAFLSALAVTWASPVAGLIVAVVVATVYQVLWTVRNRRE